MALISKNKTRTPERLIESTPHRGVATRVSHAAYLAGQLVAAVGDRSVRRGRYPASSFLALLSVESAWGRLEPRDRSWKTKSNGWKRAAGRAVFAVYPEDVDARVRLAEVFDKVAEETPSKIPASERLFSVAVGLGPIARLCGCVTLIAYCNWGFGDALTEAEEALKRGAHKCRSVAAVSGSRV